MNSLYLTSPSSMQLRRKVHASSSNCAFVTRFLIDTSSGLKGFPFLNAYEVICSTHSLSCSDVFWGNSWCKEHSSLSSLIPVYSTSACVSHLFVYDEAPLTDSFFTSRHANDTRLPF